MDIKDKIAKMKNQNNQKYKTYLKSNNNNLKRIFQILNIMTYLE